jgi:hypothetical protein
MLSDQMITVILSDMGEYGFYNVNTHQGGVISKRNDYTLLAPSSLAGSFE